MIKNWGVKALNKNINSNGKGLNNIVKEKSMNTMKKVLTLTMALVMVLSYGIISNAASTGKIVVDVANGIHSLDSTQFFAFKIFSLTWDGAEAYYYEMLPEYAPFKATYPKMSSYTDLKEYIYSMTTSTGEILSGSEADVLALGGALYKWSNDVAHLTPIPGVAGSGGVVEFTGLDAGYYVVLGVGSPNSTDRADEEVFSYAMLCTLLSDNGGEPEGVTEITIKADAPTMDKKVWNDAITSADDPDVVTDPGWNDLSTDVNIGDKVEFRLESSVPVMTGYSRYWFEAHDSLSKGLTLDQDSIEVYLGPTIAANLLTKGTTGDYDDFDALGEDADYIFKFGGGDYSPHSEFSGGTIFSITFNPDKFVDYTPLTKIYIRYSATLNEYAVISDGSAGLKGTENKAFLQYSHDPSNTGAGDNPGLTNDTPEDTVSVHTFKLDVFKFADDEDPEEGTALPGVKFELYRGPVSGGEKVELVLVDAGSSTEPAEYRVALDSESSITEMTTPASGLINISGLDADTYYLVESYVLPGFNPADPEIALIVNTNVNSSTREVTYTINSNAPAIPGDIPADINVFNGTGNLFPETGGIGRTIFLLSGLGLITSSLVSLAIRRKVRRLSEVESR